MLRFTFLHRKAVARTTLVAVILVLLLALNFTVFTVSYCQYDVTDQILTAAADIGTAVSADSTLTRGVSLQNHHLSTLPAEDFSAFYGETSFFIQILFFALLLCAFYGVSKKTATPVALCVRMDR